MTRLTDRRTARTWLLVGAALATVVVIALLVLYGGEGSRSPGVPGGGY